MKPLTYAESARLNFQLEAKEAYLMGSDEYEKCFLCGDYMMKSATVMILGETVCTDNCIGGVIEEGESVHELVMKHQKRIGARNDVFKAMRLTDFNMVDYANEMLGSIASITKEYKK